MWIVIDTNIFFDDLRLKRSLDLLFKKIENVPFSLRMPEIVVQEVINKYKEQRQAHLNRLVTSVRELKSLTILDVEIEELEDEHLANDLQAYEHFLREKILSNGEIVPIPEVSIQSLVDRDLARRRPFKENRVGFRDTLIWETIMRLATTEECEGIVFITENTKDFLENNRLHPHLVDDLTQRGLAPEIVTLFVSVEQFIETLVIPALNNLDEIKTAIQDGAHPDIDLEAITDSYIWELILGYRVSPRCLPNYQEDNEDLSLSWGVSEYEILKDELSVKQLSNNELLLTARYRLDCELDVYVPHWDIDDDFVKLGFSVSDPDWNETYALATIVLPFKITLRYVYNQETLQVTSADIVSAEYLKEDDD